MKACRGCMDVFLYLYLTLALDGEVSGQLHFILWERAPGIH